MKTFFQILFVISVVSLLVVSSVRWYKELNDKQLAEKCWNESGVVVYMEGKILCASVELIK